MLCFKTLHIHLDWLNILQSSSFTQCDRGDAIHWPLTVEKPRLLLWAGFKVESSSETLALELSLCSAARTDLQRSDLDRSETQHGISRISFGLILDLEKQWREGRYARVSGEPQCLFARWWRFRTLGICALGFIPDGFHDGQLLRRPVQLEGEVHITNMLSYRLYICGFEIDCVLCYVLS